MGLSWLTRASGGLREIFGLGISTFPKTFLKIPEGFLDMRLAAEKLDGYGKR